MNIRIRAMSQNERLYTYPQSQRLQEETENIGYLKGGFDMESKFYTEWNDCSKRYKSEEFEKELGMLINNLRYDERLLYDGESMREYCMDHSDSCFNGNDGLKYGFRIDTGYYTYLIRCSPEFTSFVCYCYFLLWFEQHLKHSINGIRFIAPNYHELFRLEDGDSIKIICPNGMAEYKKCRYIDDYHYEIGDQYYYINDLAEFVHKSENKIIPIRASLPESCFSILPSTGELIVIKRGEAGYFKSEFSKPYVEHNRIIADNRNIKFSVTKAQEAAMLAGAMFDWTVSAADPKNYDEKGTLILC